ncbi:hypothetical protein [Ilumatobacter sp.]|uniref:hypothetical protein n=1 Tax=Ilumatobacter sp. TaxID=1967498 RepID=UPI003C6EB9FE
MSITIGIDPHKASHTAVAVDDFETVIDEICIRACPSQAVLLRELRASLVRTLSTGRSQKNDPNDARSVAIAALRANDLAAVLPRRSHPHLAVVGQAAS